MGLRPTQGNEKRLGPASTLYGTVTLSLSSRPERRDLRFSAIFLYKPSRRKLSDISSNVKFVAFEPV
jgi:hypothetical protein